MVAGELANRANGVNGAERDRRYVAAVRAFSGVVLTGGRSTRMGTDKAFVLVDGQPMVQRVAAALWGAKAAAVLAVGGDLPGLAALGLDARADPRQGDGPLGGLVTAFELVPGDVAVVLATDMAWIDAATVTGLIAALEDSVEADVVAAHADRREPLCAAWRVGRCRSAVAYALAAGERAVHRAMRLLNVVDLPVEPAVVRNANTHDDLRR
jgi:molybdopterin-guanine dinucleotide biosynthesis protein A